MNVKAIINVYTKEAKDESLKVIDASRSIEEVTNETIKVLLEIIGG